MAFLISGMKQMPDFELIGVKLIYKLVDKAGRRLKKISDKLGFILYKLEFGERDDDIYIVTYPKSGTTMMQMILYHLTTHGDLAFNHIYEVSPWIRNASIRGEKPREFASPRLIKSHDFYEEFSKGVKGRFIFVFRDGMDVAVSLFHQNRNYNNPDLEFNEFISKFLSNGKTNWFKYTQDWLENKHNHTILYLRYEDLINDKEGQINKIIRFCKLNSTADQIDRALRYSSFDQMKQLEEKFGVQPPSTKMVYDQFIRRGKIGEGKKHFSPEQQDKFIKLSSSITRWADVDPIDRHHL